MKTIRNVSLVIAVLLFIPFGYNVVMYFYETTKLSSSEHIYFCKASTLFILLMAFCVIAGGIQEHLNKAPRQDPQ